MFENVLPALDPREYWVFVNSTPEDLKSPALWGVRVQVSPPAPVFMRVYDEWALIIRKGYLLTAPQTDENMYIWCAGSTPAPGTK